MYVRYVVIQKRCISAGAEGSGGGVDETDGETPPAREEGFRRGRTTSVTKGDYSM